MMVLLRQKYYFANRGVMRKTTLSLLVLLLNVIGLVAQPHVKKMETILDCSDGFSLQEEYNVEKKKGVDPFFMHLYEAVIADMFNRESVALVHLDSLVERYNGLLGSWQTARLIQKSAMILFEDGRYGEAADYIAGHQRCVSNKRDSSELLKSFHKYDKIRAVLRPEVVCPENGFVVYYERSPDPKGIHYTVPVVVNGKTYRFIYDICCAHTSVSRDLAEEMGLKMLQEDAFYGGSGSASCWNATVDSLCIGESIFRSPLLHVTPVLDSTYERTCILGNDFMRRVGLQLIYPEKHKLVYPSSGKTIRRRSNMIKGNGLYFIRASVQHKDNLFTLDTGAPTTVLLAPFYQRHKTWIDLSGKVDTVQVKEASKIATQTYGVLPTLPIKVGIKTVNVKNALLFKELHFDAFGDQNGLLGTSFIDCFRKVTVDMERMYVEFR